jgi:hypothetical protein
MYTYICVSECVCVICVCNPSPTSTTATPFHHACVCAHFHPAANHHHHSPPRYNGLHHFPPKATAYYFHFNPIPHVILTYSPTYAYDTARMAVTPENVLIMTCDLKTPDLKTTAHPSSSPITNTHAHTPKKIQRPQATEFADQPGRGLEACRLWPRTRLRDPRAQLHT